VKLRFTKMHGIGNDFVVFDAISQKVELNREQLRFVADRHFGIGCDQILFVELPRTAGVDFGYRIFNADGGEVEQCGNGARCFMRFVHDQGMTNKNVLNVETAGGRIKLYLESDGQVRVNMGVPVFEPEKIPFQAERRETRYALDMDGEILNIGAVSMGNPHAVLPVNDVQTADVARLGPRIEVHPRFPKHVNAEFMQVIARNQIKLRVYERGTGETLACGTGACAAVAVGRTQGMLDELVKVSLPGGDLVIVWQGVDQPVWMTGPASTVFEGTIDL
jgi:diaminopimelate epimerase